MMSLLNACGYVLVKKLTSRLMPDICFSRDHASFAYDTCYIVLMQLKLSQNYSYYLNENLSDLVNMSPEYVIEQLRILLSYNFLCM